MGKGATKQLGQELKGVSATERASRGRYGTALETEGQRLLRGEQTPEVEATRTFWDTQREQAANRLAVTGNRAGYGATQLELGREEGRQVSDVTRRGRLQGANILGQLYGGSTAYLGDIYGQRGQLARQPNFWQQATLAGIGAGGEAAGAYYGRG
ncbi:hypothetical protein LCGC14_0903420 [marine sediment metagenome]|uniref:Uncharacterized protein n=1 Tax=marine sediment metagenome TaxID=412755 RepID=A0A0F9S2L6_9ZZZZ